MTIIYHLKPAAARDGFGRPRCGSAGATYIVDETMARTLSRVPNVRICKRCEKKKEA